MKYKEYLYHKTHSAIVDGIKYKPLNSHLFDFQHHLVEWALNKGRSAIFADCGMGKTLMQLEWSDQIRKHTNKNILIITPLAVSHQTELEGARFGIECNVAKDGKFSNGIVITNYEQLHKYNPDDFIAVVLDESSILKNMDGMMRNAVTQFMRKVQYRLLATATPSPNDFIELGTSSEALGYLGAVDMMNKFFKNDNNNSAIGRSYGEVVKWRLKHHAEMPFWRWVCSWARAVRKPSDLGYSDAKHILPKLKENQHIIQASSPRNGMLFNLPALDMNEQRIEKRRTIKERCEKVAGLIPDTETAIAWCHLNEESKMLKDMIKGAVEVSGSDSDDVKCRKLDGFISGEHRVLVTKPSIGAWGLNLQHCNRMTFFPSHSFEQYYQAVRRCYRFGQTKIVIVDVIGTDGDEKIFANMKRKAIQAEEMFSKLVANMNNAITFESTQNKKQEVFPSWL